MGTCHKCGRQVTLQDKEVKCDNCFATLTYPCNSCKHWFSIQDEETKYRRKECGICGFFVCPHCGNCSPDCEKELWQTKINKILAPEINYSKFLNLQIKINKIMELIEEIKIGKEKRQCQKRKVPLTYAKQRIKSCVVKMKGFRTKNQKDIDKFNERMEEVLDKDIGTKLTINQSREAGSYGQEYRDVFNYCLCEGVLEKQKVNMIIDGEEKEMEIYKRVENGKCLFLDLKELITNSCPKCQTKYDEIESQCTNNECIMKSGKNKGQLRKLRLKISNKDICQLNRGLFLKDGESQPN